MKKGELELELGVSALGWTFCLYVYPEHQIHSLEDWIKFFRQPDVTIISEYGDPLTVEAMMKEITERKSNVSLNRELPSRYKSWQDFLDRNEAELGPNRLLRRRKPYRIWPPEHYDPATYDIVVYTG